jgi:WD40 repeat protein
VRLQEDGSDSTRLHQCWFAESKQLTRVGVHAQVLSLKFDPSGKFCATAGHDKDILLWEV